MKFKKKTQVFKNELRRVGCRLMSRVRKACAMLMCASLITAGFPSADLLAFASADSVEYSFVFDSDELYRALSDAVSEGFTVNKELDLKGEHADEYLDILAPDGCLYELKDLEPQRDKSRDKVLDIRAFVRIEGDMALDGDIEVNGSEQVFFLLINKSEEEIASFIRIDDNRTETVTVPAGSSLAVDKQDIDSMTGAGGKGSSAAKITEDPGVEGQSGSDSGSEAKAAVSENDNIDKDKDKGNDQSSAGDENDKAGTGDKAGSGDKPDTGDKTNQKEKPGRGDKTDTKDKPDHGDKTGTKDKPDCGDKSDSKDKNNSDSGRDQSKKDDTVSGRKQASASVHRAALLTAPAASASDVYNTRTASVSDASPSDAGSRIWGEVYDPVLLGKNGAVLFATTMQEIGFSNAGIMLLGVDDGPQFTYEFNYNGGYAGLGVNLLDEHGNNIGGTAENTSQTVSMPYTFTAGEFADSNITTEEDYEFCYATVTDPNYWDTVHEFDPGSHVGEQEAYGDEDNPIISMTISQTAADSSKGEVSRTWHYELTYEDGSSETISVYGNSNGKNDKGGLYCPLYLELNLYFSCEDAAQNLNTRQFYTKLRTAIEEAAAGDTIILCRDIDEKVISEDQYTIGKDLTLDLDGHSITAECEDSTLSLFNISGGVKVTIRNGTIEGILADGGQKAKGNAIYGRGSGENSLVHIILEDLTVKNFGTASNYGTIYIYDGSLSAENCSFLSNDNSAVTLRSSAGDARLYDDTGLMLRSCEISGNVNSSNNYGGGVGVRQIFSVSVEECTIKDNKFLSTPEGIYGGGGMILYNAGEISLKDNKITDNESSLYGGGILILSGSAFALGDRAIIEGNTITGNRAALNGGGLTYFINTLTHDDDAYCIFMENTIDDNYTAYDGGGMSMYSNDPDLEFTILSGTVSNNTAAQWSGGIDFAWERPSTLHLYNALITENSAFQGGGVWMCSTSETVMYVTFGGAIYGNSTTDTILTPPCGDEIRFRGSSDDGYDGIVVNVAPRALGGTLMEWYTDEYGARYKDGLGTLIDVTGTEYKDRTSAFSLHGELGESGITLVQNEASTIISGNKAENGYGGGIASNARLVFGEGSIKEISGIKKWSDENGDAIVSEDEYPESVEVTLVRIDEENIRTYLETVTLNKDNDWSWTFKDLPDRYLTYDGSAKEYAEHFYTYEIYEETEAEGFAVSYVSSLDDKGNDMIIITNTRESEETPDPEGNPPGTLEHPRGHSGGGGSSGGSSKGGSGIGGPGDSDGSGDDGGIWDLLPLPAAGQGRALLFGAAAFALSAMALITLFRLRRRSPK